MKIKESTNNFLHYTECPYNYRTIDKMIILCEKVNRKYRIKYSIRRFVRDKIEFVFVEKEKFSQKYLFQKNFRQNKTTSTIVPLETITRGSNSLVANPTTNVPLAIHRISPTLYLAAFFSATSAS